jgi:hypothetical protein
MEGSSGYDNAGPLTPVGRVEPLIPEHGQAPAEIASPVRPTLNCPNWTVEGWSRNGGPQPVPTELPFACTVKRHYAIRRWRPAGRLLL